MGSLDNGAHIGQNCFVSRQIGNYVEVADICNDSQVAIFKSAIPILPVTNGLEFLLDAFSLNSFVLNGNKVASWGDEDSGIFLTQSNNNLRPVLDTSTFALPTVRFNASDEQYLTGPPPVLTAPFSAYAVFASTNSFVTQGTLWTLSDLSASNDDYWTVFANQPQGQIRHGISDTTPVSSNAGLYAPNILNLVVVREISATDHNVQLNDDAESSFSTSLTPDNIDTLTIGAFTSSDNFDSFYDGWIAEFLLYSRILSSDENTAVRNYLKNKWTITTY